MRTYHAARRGPTPASIAAGLERTHVYDFGLGRVNLVFASRDEDVRRAVRGDLRSRGLTAVRAFGQAGAMAGAVAEDCPDLLVCDQDLPGIDVCDFIHRLRNQEGGSNPFLLVIMLLADPSVERIRRAIDAGPDDIVVAPAGAGAVGERFMRLLQRRKPFVVTADYVGPTRRKQARAGREPAPLVEVPNTARLKAERPYSPEAIQRLVDEACLRVNARKLERQAVQVSWRVERVKELWRAERRGPPLRPHLERLTGLAQEIDRRLCPNVHGHVTGMCLSLANVAGSLLNRLETPDAKAIELLPPIAVALEKALRVGEGAIAVSHDISHRVDRRYGPARG